MTKLKERLDGINTVNTLLVEAGAKAGPTAVSTLRLAQIETRKARLDVLRRLQQGMKKGALDMVKVQVNFASYTDGTNVTALTSPGRGHPVRKPRPRRGFFLGSKTSRPLRFRDDAGRCIR
ncbi:hypothetical protein [Microvirga aerophila]|uniref:Uncharacterized protein n=1 Tax=Microvirga aerophila TaxID=670291 RepID=A0A512BT46_9HYPH|nr:hypothetical protein [Microvirga aerophila]GEO14967.1 hypothetical protein MAE02_26630 [Microvirga aerophila]